MTNRKDERNNNRMNGEINKMKHEKAKVKNHAHNFLHYILLSFHTN